MEKIKIDKGIPLPKRRRRSLIYPFGDMKIGDSFFVESEDKSIKQIRALQTCICSAKRYYIKEHNETMFTTSIIHTVEKCGVRCWRTK